MKLNYASKPILRLENGCLQCVFKPRLSVQLYVVLGLAQVIFVGLKF
jgi:hypothetical protein